MLLVSSLLLLDITILNVHTPAFAFWILADCRASGKRGNWKTDVLSDAMIVK